MYKVNDTIIHFRDGVSTVVGTTEMGGRSYYLVRALRGSGESIYVPMDTATNIIRDIITVEVADKVIKHMKDSILELTANTKQRRDAFKRRLSSGSPFEMGFLAKQLFLFVHQAELGQTIKFGPADLDMLKLAKDILYDELALVYKKDRDTIEKFVETKMAKA